MHLFPPSPQDSRGCRAKEEKCGPEGSWGSGTGGTGSTERPWPRRTQGWGKSCLLRKPSGERGWPLPEPWDSWWEGTEIPCRSECSQDAGSILTSCLTPHLVNKGEFEVGPRCRSGIYPIHPRFSSPTLPKSPHPPQHLNFLSRCQSYYQVFSLLS